MTGVWTRVLTTDTYPVPIGILNPVKICFDAINYENFRIDRHPQSSVACGWQCSSTTEDMGNPVTSGGSSREERQAIETKEEHSR